MELYVSVVQYGNYEEKTVSNIYVGGNFEEAKQSILKYKCDFGYIEIWINGINTNSMEVK